MPRQRQPSCRVARTKSSVTPRRWPARTGQSLPDGSNACAGSVTSMRDTLPMTSPQNDSCLRRDALDSLRVRHGSREGVALDGCIVTGIGHQHIPAAFEPLLTMATRCVQECSADASRYLYGSVATGDVLRRTLFVKPDQPVRSFAGPDGLWNARKHPKRAVSPTDFICLNQVGERDTSTMSRSDLLVIEQSVSRRVGCPPALTGLGPPTRRARPPPSPTTPMLASGAGRAGGPRFP